MTGDETSTAYLTRAQEYASALANIGQPMSEKDIVMLVVAGLRHEYNGVKQSLLARQFTAVFSELRGILADHEFLIRKPVSDVTPVQAFMATTTASSSLQTDIQALQQLVSRLGFQLQPTSSTPTAPQAYYTNQSGPSNGSRGRGGFNSRGRGRDQNQGGNRNQGQFSWASNQNTVYGTCNRCGIGHVPSQCLNRDPSTFRSRQPSANYADTRSHASTFWLPDTGSNNHVAPDMMGFDSAESYYGDDNLHVGNSNALPILHIGSSRLYSPNKTFHLNNILHVPQIKKHLLSVQKFCKDNHVYFEFHAIFFAVKDTSTHSTLLTGPSDGGLYSINLPISQSLPKVVFSTTRTTTTTWHQRLGHPHSQLFQTMLSKYCLPVSNKTFDFHCNSCSVGKSSKLNLLSSDYKSSHILDLVFCDVWGPALVTSFDGHTYFLLCVDHFSKFMWLFPLKRKSDVFDMFKRFVSLAERQFSTKLKTVQTDWGGEFRNLSHFFSSIAIIHRLSCPHTREQNGVVERRHRHVVETGLTLMAQSHVPKRFWHFAFETAVYLINRMPSRTNSTISPFEHLFKHKPDFSFLRVFGCQCYPHLRPYNHNKMDLRSTSCIFLGYSTAHHGYRCFDPDTERIYIARHVRFNENSFPFSTPCTDPSPFPPNSPYVSSYPTPIPTTHTTIPTFSSPTSSSQSRIPLQTPFPHRPTPSQLPHTLVVPPLNLLPPHLLPLTALPLHKQPPPNQSPFQTLLIHYNTSFTTLTTSPPSPKSKKDKTVRPISLSHLHPYLYPRTHHLCRCQQ
ncbi:hypothetical protein OSB04_003516 [Centaurea solstitialis]|uniref:Integrase catalytic domain-containing protein n=1 Tax=Centaurea solstitialis TaxID=347529 RepID=A0AA38U6P3_9ASTR|nr:hypothetical protein OSB04_003516 [Centaurea solstitialis]